MAYPEETDETVPRVTKETQVPDTWQIFGAFSYPFSHPLTTGVLFHLPSPTHVPCRHFSKPCSAT